MTCVSLRSGIASSGVCAIAWIASTTATSTPPTVARGCRAHQPITRSIAFMGLSPWASPLARRRAQPALRGDEEVARRHDALAGSEPARYLVPAAGAGAQRHVARREP